jgi:hypothetical protein
MSQAAITKKLLIESQAANGKCYVRLIPVVPNFKKASAALLEIALESMVKNLKQNPIGTDVLSELFICNKILEGQVNFETESLEREVIGLQWSITGASEFMDDVFASTFRFSWEEIGGVQHIGSYIDGFTLSKDVFNELGWSARYVICMLANPGARIGSESGYGGLFEKILNAAKEDEELPEEDDEESTPKAINSRKQSFNDSGFSSGEEHLRYDLHDKYSEMEKLNDQIKMLQRRISKGRSQQAEDLDEKTVRRFAQMLSKQGRLRRVKTELEPSDSSSVAERYESDDRFMEDGTVFEMRGPGRTELSTIQEIQELRPQREIVVGFKKTPDMSIQEGKVYKRVSAINGLANPFHSHRLNFLCHFDTAIKSITLRRSDFSHYDTLSWILDHKSVTPSQELLYQVVKNTFDISQNRIIANPYKLPFLEVGMIISDDCLAKCFELLKLEYKQLWFEKMKGLIVPEFHSDFSNYKEHKVTRSKDRVVDVTQNIRSPRQELKEGKKKKSESIFSITR